MNRRLIILLKFSILIGGITFIMWGWISSNRNRVIAQSNVCDRNDFSYLDGLDATATPPTPLKSTQPGFSTINDSFNAIANVEGIPSWVPKAVANQETRWHQIDKTYPNTVSQDGCIANAGDYDCTCVSSSGDYGIMQINWKFNKGTSGWDWNLILNDYSYNIERGLEELIDKSKDITVNDNDLGITGNPINWYLKFWAYNGKADTNNPADDLKDRDRNWNGNQRLSCAEWPKVVGSAELDYTYQEKVLYRAWCESDLPSVDWEAIGMFPIPDDDLFASELFPSDDIVIFDVQATFSCNTRQVAFDYQLNTTESIYSQITISDDKPWPHQVGGSTVTGSPIKTLPQNLQVWNGTNTLGQTLPDGVYWYTVEVKKNGGNQLMGMQSGPVTLALGGCPNDLYLPIVLKPVIVPTPTPTSTPSSTCADVGKVLVFDDFDGDGQHPFDGPPTGTARWIRNRYDGFPTEPDQTGLDDHGRDTNGIKFGGNDNEPAEQAQDRHDFDQQAYVPFFMPGNVTQIKVSFDALLVSTEHPQVLGTFDHFYWDLRVTPDTSNLDHKYDCNEDVAQDHIFCWNDTWVDQVSFYVNVLSAWQGQEVGGGFWVDVNQDNTSIFYVDNYKVEVSQCQ